MLMLDQHKHSHGSTSAPFFVVWIVWNHEIGADVKMCTVNQRKLGRI